MYILGISCFYHDSSACLLKNGEVIAACEEEKFSRKKHDFSFPFNAIEYCLEYGGINIQDISHIAFYEKPLLKFERILYQHITTFPKSFKVFVSSMPSWFTRKLRVLRIIKKKLKYKGDVIFVPHHMSHAAGTFFASDFKKAAVLVVDGVGEWATTSLGLAKDNEIEIIKEIKFPHSLGLFYSALTAYLGFRVNNSEYKVMGLSSYGVKDKKKNKYYDKLKQVIDIKNDGSFHLDMNYFSFHYSDIMPAKNLCVLLGGNTRKKEEKLSQRHKDIAAALQILTEEVVIKILNYLYIITEQDNIVFSGGVALNSVLNGKILRNTNFKNIYIQPAAGDGGTSLGAAWYVWHVVLKRKRCRGLLSPYLGPEYKNEEIKRFLVDKDVEYIEYLSIEKLIQETAQLIYNNNIVAWFQGRTEWGPRALGARSILANPLCQDIQNILNIKVKRRESFRPFAPAICLEDVFNFFDSDLPLPLTVKYMLMVYGIKKEWRDELPGIVHVDGSSRLQSVVRADNPRYYDLLRECGKISGVPILINTSFNVRGESIVNSPEEALACFEGTNIDYLIMENFLIQKKNDF